MDRPRLGGTGVPPVLCRTKHGRDARATEGARAVVGLVIALLAVTAGRATAADLALVPRPVVITPKDGTFTLTPQTQIAAEFGATAEATLLAEALRPATGLSLRVVDAPGQRGAIAFKLVAMDKLEPVGTYTLDVAPDGVTIQATGTAGLFYGAQTLRQLLPPAAFSPTPVTGVTWSIPCVHIEDRPRFRWRGLMLDCSRHFFTVEYVERFIDLLAAHKMNTFHWHLTDDQGWRIEIKRYPKLTEVGSRRAETLIGHPAKDPADDRYDGTPYGGFYTQDDIRHVVAYAAARHVVVVPEIEMPGHATAAIAAYPELGVGGRPTAVWGSFGIQKHILDPSPATVTFFQNVLAEVIELFPSPYIHVGGDEAPKDEWNGSPSIQAQVKSLGLKDSDALQSWFIGQMDGYLTAHGRHLIGWDEILQGGLTPGAAVMSWHGDSAAAVAARADHAAVNAASKSTYFNYYQSKAHVGEPYTGGRVLQLEMVYAFDPMPPGLTAGEQSFVLGGQGQVWTPYIATPAWVEYAAYPRACAMAEDDWSPAAGKDYADFLVRLRFHMDRLKAAGVNARPLDPAIGGVGK
jgi:hexosaminidase